MKRIVFAFMMLVAYLQPQAQCAQCTAVDCSATKPTGGLCNYLPDDTAGQPYDEVISFYMPKVLTDPTTLGQCGGCSSVTLRRIDVVGIQGLPPGLTYTASQNGSYNVQGGDSTGCVRFCGTPVAPGTYYIIVNLLADVTANGVPVIGSVQADDQAQQYRDTIVIFPGVSDCPGTFSLGNGPCVTQSCDSVGVNLSAQLVNANCSNLISYDWNLGNGQTSTLKNPGAVNYNTPDTFPLTLTTTFYTYRIKSVFVNITGGYTGDTEELFGSFNPDPYIRINSLAFSNRGTGSDQKTITYNNLNLVIPDAECANAIEIQVWDEDTGPPQGTNPVGSPDDQINNHMIFPSVPNQVTSNMNNSNIAVTFDTVATSSVTETINIVVHPKPPVPEILFAADTVCTGDSTQMSLSVPVDGYLVNWYLNDTTELLTNDSATYIKTAGKYTAKVTNNVTGCSEWAAPKYFQVAAPAPAAVTVYYNGTQLFVSPFPSTGFAVQWFYNDNLVAGQNGKFLPYLGDGDYTAVVYNSSFPSCSVASAEYTLVTGSINTPYSAVAGVTVYPNPNNGRFTLELSTLMATDLRIALYNAVGQVVYAENLNGFNGDLKKDIDVAGLPKGVYTLGIQGNGTNINKRVVVQ